jgi:hypothetical protein
VKVITFSDLWLALTLTGRAFQGLAGVSLGAGKTAAISGEGDSRRFRREAARLASAVWMWRAKTGLVPKVAQQPAVLRL